MPGSSPLCLPADTKAGCAPQLPLLAQKTTGWLMQEHPLPTRARQPSPLPRCDPSVLSRLCHGCWSLAKDGAQPLLGHKTIGCCWSQNTRNSSSAGAAGGSKPRQSFGGEILCIPRPSSGALLPPRAECFKFRTSNISINKLLCIMSN